MKNILTIAGKEINAYFRSPVAYIVTVLMIMVFNILFFAIIDENREAVLLDVFQAMEFMFIFFLPLITMRMFAEEKSSGTMEFLMTSPISNTEIVLGKYLGSLAFFTVTIVITFSYYVIIEVFGNPDRLTILSGYIGIWMEGAFFISIGMLASSWTKNQVIAAVTSYVGLFILYSSIIFIKYFDKSLEPIVQYFSTYTHAENFFMGIISTSDIIYYISGIIIMIVLTRVSIENRSWR